MAFDDNAGVNRLARVLANRMKKEGSSPLVADFGKIQKDGSLLTNTFPVPIPKGDYSICQSLAIRNAGGLQPGTSVLVSWVMDDAIVVDIIVRS